MSWQLLISKQDRIANSGRASRSWRRARRWARHLTFAMTLLLFSTSRGSAVDDDAQSQQLFRNVLEQVQKFYVAPVETQPLVETAIGAMLASLDPESGYLAAGAPLPSAAYLAGDLPELGLNLSFEPQTLLVVSVTDNGPADRLGFRTGDRILAVNNTPVQESSLYQAMNNLRQTLNAGPVTLLMQRTDRQIPLSVKIAKSANPTINNKISFKLVDFAIKEEPVKKSASADTINDKNSLATAANSSSTGAQIAPIVVVRIPRFTEASATELEAVLKQASTAAAASTSKTQTASANTGQFSGLILDLRQNPGGSTDGAIAASNLFLKSGLITSLVPRNLLKPVNGSDSGVNTNAASASDSAASAPSSDTVVDYSANPSKSSALISKLLPIVVIVDRGTSGATEIFAAALKDNNRAVIVGNRSFGQASFHRLLPLSNGGNLFLTVAKWRRPNGQMINDGGIQPDILVNNPVPVLQGTEFGKTKDLPPAAPGKNSPIETVLEDSQMLRSLDAIRSMVVYANLSMGKK